MTPPVLAPAKPAAVAGVTLTDRHGDTWHAVGRDDHGDLLLVCDAPRNPDDQGIGPARPWTYGLADRWFGPLASAQVTDCAVCGRAIPRAEVWCSQLCRNLDDPHGNDWDGEDY